MSKKYKKKNLYFAYGSNLHPIRLEDRLGKVDFHGIGKLSYTEIHFHKTGSDGSGKATIESSSERSKYVLGAMYELSKSQEKLLDKFESLGFGYNKLIVEVELEKGEEITCFTYQGMREYVDYTCQPFHWYKQLVAQGSRFLGFPSEYTNFIENIDSIADLNKKRVNTNERLIKLMQKKKVL
ncbi:MAG: gamma-glutamylcyclotransferase [Gracilimonas sp.]|uniref:gamma-glutamylcyclotransferase family protein n=1 Tax=Gracilimonas sp. TaxID=1974203 RepID=UPI0019C5ACCB|nr:gamma-glutamylcyclotransferase family protein [Gracilimonas sp.]MBD3617240.1 gamma-glutamylcyclotransferase [Gracilimonas sp.]